MIKRYILHIEFHWGYWPKVHLRRIAKPGDRVLDGGVPGTLKRCPTCQDGLLHEPDLIMTKVEQTDRGLRVSLRPAGSNHETAPAIDFNAPFPSDFVDAPLVCGMDRTHVYSLPKAKVSMQSRDDQDLTELLLAPGSLRYNVGEIVWYNNGNHRVVAFEENKRVLLRRLED